MSYIEISDPVIYTPSLVSVPERWAKSSFKDLNFIGRDSLKKFVENYLVSFESNGCDSLLFYPNDFGYQLLISLYKEVASRITIDSYRFINWTEYAGSLKGMRKDADKFVQTDLFDVNFVFIIDLADSNGDLEYFVKILMQCYINGTKLIAATRLSEDYILDKLPQEVIGIYEKKIGGVKIS